MLKLFKNLLGRKFSEERESILPQVLQEIVEQADTLSKPKRLVSRPLYTPIEPPIGHSNYYSS